MKWKEVIQRWKAPTPHFWKSIKKRGLYLGGLGTAVGTVQAQFPKLHIPELIFTLSTHLAVAGFIMVVVANLTCDDPELLVEEEAKRKGNDSVG